MKKLSRSFSVYTVNACSLPSFSSDTKFWARLKKGGAIALNPSASPSGKLPARRRPSANITAHPLTPGNWQTRRTTALASSSSSVMKRVCRLESRPLRTVVSEAATGCGLADKVSGASLGSATGVGGAAEVFAGVEGEVAAGISAGAVDSSTANASSTGTGSTATGGSMAGSAGRSSTVPGTVAVRASTGFASNPSCTGSSGCAGSPWSRGMSRAGSADVSGSTTGAGTSATGSGWSMNSGETASSITGRDGDSVGTCSVADPGSAFASVGWVVGTSNRAASSSAFWLNGVG